MRVPSPFGSLEEQVAVVTGGNSGIGLGMARGLAAAGADIVILGTNAEKNDAARAELEQAGGRVLALRCDVGDEASVEAAFAEAVDAFGAINACFANAGVAAAAAPFVDQTLEDWRRVLRVNVEGVFLTLRAAARTMIDTGTGGSLVGVSSVGELMGMPQMQAYASSKAAVTAMINGLAVELARHRIRANSILPGFIQTAMTPHFDTEPYQRHVLRRVPMRRWGDPADFAGIAVYLASAASSYHTGQSFVVDGGYNRF